MPNTKDRADYIPATPEEARLTKSSGTARDALERIHSGAHANPGVQRALEELASLEPGQKPPAA